jgi:hypothetical protein
MSRYWKAFFACAVALSVSGCGVIQQHQQAEQQAAADKRNAGLKAQLEVAEQQCRATYPSGKRTIAVARARCFAQAGDRFIRPTHSFPDLLDLVDTNRMVLAEKVEKAAVTAPGTSKRAEE